MQWQSKNKLTKQYNLIQSCAGVLSHLLRSVNMNIFFPFRSDFVLLKKKILKYLLKLHLTCDLLRFDYV